MSETFNTFDLIFISFSLIFIVVAFFRGFVKEIFMLLIWISALVISYFGAPLLAKALSSYSNNKMVLDIASRTTLFIITFFTLLFSTSDLIKGMQDKMPDILDRSLGILYGIAKSLLIFGVFYAVLANLYAFLLGKQQDPDGKKIPSWMVEAKCGNIVRIAGEAIDPIVETFIGAIIKNFDKPGYLPKTLDDKIDEVVEEDKITNHQTNVKSNKKSSAANSQETGQTAEDELNDHIEKETGYDKKNIDKLGRLIDVINKVNN